jgi:hypothetical protein
VISAQAAFSGQVPPRARPQQRHPDQAGQRQERSDEQERADRERPRDDRDQRLRHGVPHAAGERVDVPGGTGDQVAGTGPFHRRQRQCQHTVDELLAQCGEHLLAQPGGGIDRVPHEDRLRDREAGDRERDRVYGPVRGAALDLLHQVADQPRRGEAAHRGQAMCGQREAEVARVAHREPARVRPDLRGRGDRQYLVHRVSSFLAQMAGLDAG